MSGLTIAGRLERRVPRQRTAQQKPEPPKRPAIQDGPSRTARLLALAYLIERMIDSGELASYAEAAERFGLSRARVTQVMNLLALSPSWQEAILTERVVVAERGLRKVVQHAVWEDQERLLVS